MVCLSFQTQSPLSCSISSIKKPFHNFIFYSLAVIHTYCFYKSPSLRSVLGTRRVTGHRVRRAVGHSTFSLFRGLNGWFRGQKALLFTQVCLSLALRVLAEPQEPGSLVETMTVTSLSCLVWGGGMAIFLKFRKTVKSDTSVARYQSSTNMLP